MTRIRSRKEPTPGNKGHGKDENAAFRQEDAVALAPERGPLMTVRSRSQSAPSPHASEATMVRDGSSLPWEDWFSAATTQQQRDAFELARQQGFLYPHQLTAVEGQAAVAKNGSAAHPLHDFLRADLSLLKPVIGPANPVECPDLDETQREAVRRALDSPDVFLLQGPPGVGISRVVAETLRHACKRGLRTLFVAYYPESLDSALRHLASDRDVLVLRYLGPDELTASLSPEIQALILSRRRSQFAEQIDLASQKLRSLCDLQARQQEQEEAVWAQACSLADQLARCERERIEAESLREELPNRVQDWCRDGTHPLCARLAEKESQRDADQVNLGQQIQTASQHLSSLQSSLAELERRLDELRPYAEARRHRRWWTLTWWKALRRGDVVTQYDQLVAECKQKQDGITAQKQSLTSLESRRQQLDTAWEMERSRILTEEQDRQAAEIAERVRTASMRSQELQSALSQGFMGLLSDDAAGGGVADMQDRHRAWQERMREQGEKHKLLVQWLAYLEEAKDQFVGRLPTLANVVAVPVDALPPEHADICFDLLVVEDAQCLTDSDLVRLASHGKRVVLCAAHETNPDPDPQAPPRPRDALALRTRCFRKLWKQLHREPAIRGVRWTLEGDRLCCHMHPVSPAERGRLEVERLVDFPEIELRILCSSTPCLAEILFPPGMDIGQAKLFIYREMQEVALCRPGANFWVSEDASSVRCFLASASDAAPGVPAELEPGLREWATAKQTLRFEFDKACGWTRPAAEHWLEQKLGLRDSGRTLFLDVFQRAGAGLGGILAEVFFPDHLQSKPIIDSDQSGVVFVPVPRPAADNGARAHANGASSPTWPREGAGLEIDLAAIRPVDRIPNDLKSMLPRKGFANFFEAQAVVKYLERHFSQLAKATALPNNVAIIALYPGQVELIRLLIDRSDPLKGHSFLVGLPQDFRQREFGTVLLSLTRSHSHRAVALGQDPSDLPLAFSRARERVVLFADPGNLIKRAAWKGPLEHLDATTAQHESKHILPLVRYLQGQGTHQAAWQVEA